MIAVGTLLGFAFLTKMMQAFLVVPGFALVYMIAAPTSMRRRIAQLLAGGAAMILSAVWWVAIVALWPAASRPMIDGSADNSILNLIFGYNGLGRLTGSGGGGGGGAGGGFSGQTGVLRLFNDLMGGQASWLLPAALVVLVVGLAWRLRAPRTDRVRAALLLWGGWLVVSGLVFSLSSGVIHTYYTVALAPPIAALVALGTTLLWRQRERLSARWLLALGVLLTAGWSIVLLARTPSWEPWLIPVVALAGALSAAAVLAPPRLGRRVTATVAMLAFVACLAGPLAYSAQTIASVHTGSVPSAGPATSAGGGPGGGQSGGGLAAAANAGAGGAPGTSTTSSELITLLKNGASGYRWAAATSGSQNAASLELATGGLPVMAIGGFNNQGGNLSLAQFEAYVKAGDIHYYLAGGAGVAGGPGGASSTSAITSWVRGYYRAESVGGQTVYDLSQPVQS
jgi:4-amino-4-deoxy-L-arabinose transferase-like glycosyltransferase